MSEGAEVVVRAVLMGIGATAALDLWNALLKSALGIPSLNLRMLGRWLGHFPRGRFVQHDIANAAPVRGELLLGWTAHYTIGITFAALLLAICGLDWARHPTLLPALALGLVTVAAPLFVMQPGMGMGVAASRAPNPKAARLKSLVSHAVFGVGLYGSALLSSLLIRP